MRPWRSSALLAVLTLVFFLVRIVPGDPALVVLGDQASPDALASMREWLGLNKPLIVQYVEYLGGIVQGDLGRSLTTNRPVMADVLAVLPHTIELTFASLLVGILGGVPLGVMAAMKRNGIADWLARIVSLIGLSFPAFVSGVLLLVMFAVQYRWFPVISAPRSVKANFRTMRAMLKPAVRATAVVKSDAYGLDLAPVAKASTEAECDFFFVANLDEALLLRPACPDVSIAVFYDDVVKYEAIYRSERLIPVINSLREIELLVKSKSVAPYILNVDTGSARFSRACRSQRKICSICKER
jgi:Alanine racemase, N-terminal domain/Binding-prot-dependent transport system membrane comp, N-term/Binding-protein-dependent transport system inner membrane component